MRKIITSPLDAWDLGHQVATHLGKRAFGQRAVEKIAREGTFGRWSSSHLWALVRLAERFTRPMAERAAWMGMSVWDCVTLLPLLPRKQEKLRAEVNEEFAYALWRRGEQFEAFLTDYEQGLRGQKFRAQVVRWMRANDHLWSVRAGGLGRKRSRAGCLKVAVNLRTDLKLLLKHLRSETSEAYGSRLKVLAQQIESVERFLENLEDVLGQLDAPAA